MYNAAFRPAAPRYAPRLSSTQGFVMYNATNVATWLWAPQRLATRLRVLRRASIQLNDLFVSFRASTPSDLARRVAAPRNATQLNDLFVNLLSHRGALQCNASQFNSAPRYAAQRFVCYFSRLDTALLCAARYVAAPRSATQRFVCYNASPRPSAQRSATWRNAIQRFVCQFIIAPRHGSRQRTAAQLGLPRRAATQRNELKLN